MRKSLIGAFFVAVVVAGLVLAGNALVCGASSDSDSWYMFRHDLQRTGHSTSSAPAAGEVMWVYNTTVEMDSSPAVVDGRVIAALGNGDIYALNATTGAVLWVHSVEPGQNLIWSSPAVDSGRIYIGTRGSNVYCLNISNGDLLWSYPTDSQTNCSPLVSDGRVYISSDDGKLYCLNSVDGSLMWRYSLSNASINGFSSPAFLNGTVYVGAVINYDSPNVFAIDASTGASKWNYTVDGGTTASPAISGNRVFIGSSNGKVYCLDAINGSQVWNATIGSNWFAGIYMSSPAIADGMLFVGSGDSNCYCLNASNGSQIWKAPTKQMIWSSPAVADGKVYIGSSDGRLYCFNEYTGEQMWSYYTLGRVVSSPAVYGGAVYVGCGTSMPGEGKSMPSEPSTACRRT